VAYKRLAASRVPIDGPRSFGMLTAIVLAGYFWG
jgi:hypothetical protein